MASSLSNKKVKIKLIENDCDLNRVIIKVGTNFGIRKNHCVRT